MTRKNISNAIGGISDKYLIEAMEGMSDSVTENPGEVIEMKPRKSFAFRKAASIAIAACLVLGLCTTAYAMDFGGIQRTVQVWIHGDQTNATLTIETGEYTSYDLKYKDSEDKDVHQSGGGVAFNEDGTERPVTEEELAEDVLHAPEVSWGDDGRIWVYYMNQKMDITDQFDNGYCFVKLEVGGETKYMTVKYSDQTQGGLGYGLSTHSFLQPNEFSVSSDMNDDAEP